MKSVACENNNENYVITSVNHDGELELFGENDESSFPLITVTNEGSVRNLWK